MNKKMALSRKRNVRNARRCSGDVASRATDLRFRGKSIILSRCSTRNSLSEGDARGEAFLEKELRHSASSQRFIRLAFDSRRWLPSDGPVPEKERERRAEGRGKEGTRCSRGWLPVPPVFRAFSERHFRNSRCSAISLSRSARLRALALRFDAGYYFCAAFPPLSLSYCFSTTSSSSSSSSSSSLFA